MTLYLSRLVLDPRSRDVRRDLADCHALHQRLMTGFPTVPGQDARASFGVLYRLEGPPFAAQPSVIVQSAVAPNWARLPERYLGSTFDGSDNPACKRVDERYAAIAAGNELAFRLRANPTRRVSTGQAGADRLAGKRVALLKEPEQLDWLARKAEAGGFALLSVRAETNDLQPINPATTAGTAAVVEVRAMPGGEQVGFRSRAEEGGRARLTFGVVVFEGRLRVVDAGGFRATLEAGIGSGKAYGFGLLSVAPAARV
jgi:CRISPR system Cascade subunit CasE